MSIIQKWNGTKIHIRDDRYVNATDMAKATDKQYYEWRRSKETQEYLQALSKRCNLSIDKQHCITEKQRNTKCQFLIDVQRGKTGTYLHPKLALRFAQWCSAEFALEYWLQVKRGQKTLPVVQASLNRISQLKTTNKVGEKS